MGCKQSKDIFDMDEFNYKGEVKFNKEGMIMDGMGKQENPDGSFYVGKFKYNMYNGKGIMKYKIDDESHAVQPVNYNGNWINNNRVGYGELTFSDGSFYKGEFNYDNMHGKGSYFFESGEVYVGNFINGIIEGKGDLFDSNDNIIYSGDFSDGLYNGFGKLYKNGKLVYQGNFVNNEYHGYGQLYDTIGNIIFDGMFSHGSNYVRERSQAITDGVTSDVVTSNYVIPTATAVVVPPPEYNEDPYNYQETPSIPN